MSGLFHGKFLRMFGEGGGAGAGGDGGAAGGTEGTGAAAQAQATGTTPGAAGKADDLSQVVYGRQAAQEAPKDNDAGQENGATETKPENHKATFDELMQDPEYKAEFQKRFDKQFNKRFAENKAQSEQMAKLAPALNLLAGKYGTRSGDVDGLIEAINQDNDLIERQAYDKGMEPDAYREYNRVMAENQALRQAEQERQRQTQINEQYARWTQQAEQARAIYPGLDLRAEAQNPQFAQLLGAGIDVATAYQVVHMGELSSQLVQKSAQEAKESTVRAIQANQGRPRENGSAKGQAAAVKSDPSKLTAKDYEEIIRRAGRGEKIRF